MISQDDLIQVLRPPLREKSSFYLAHFLTHLDQVILGQEHMECALISCDDGLLGAALTCDYCLAVDKFQGIVKAEGRKPNEKAYSLIQEQFKKGYTNKTFRLITGYSHSETSILLQNPKGVPNTLDVGVLRSKAEAMILKLPPTAKLRQTYVSYLSKRRELAKTLTKKLVSPPIRELIYVLFQPEHRENSLSYITTVTACDPSK